MFNSVDAAILEHAYIINWIISFVSNRKQRVVLDGFTTNYLSINRGIPQGTVLGQILFSLMVNDICAADEKNNLLVKFADDITVTVPVRNGKHSASLEVNNMRDWCKKNYMSLNLPKTWEMVIHVKTSKPKPQPLQDIKRKESLSKLLGITFQDKPTSWNICYLKLQVDYTSLGTVKPTDTPLNNHQNYSTL